MRYIITLMTLLVGLAGCAEEPRMTPGFQTITLDPDPTASGVEFSPASSGRVAYYGQIQDQGGLPIDGALVLFELYRTSKWVNHAARPPTVWRVYTHTDREGRFSVVGGRGHAWGCRIAKPGFTPLDISCQLDARGHMTMGRLSHNSPVNPERMVMWRNTGFNQNSLVEYRALGMDVPWPTASPIHIDLVQGRIATGDEPWDIECAFNFSLRVGEINVNDVNSYEVNKGSERIRINRGAMVYIAKYNNERPLVPWNDARLSGGVVVSALLAETMPIYYSNIGNTKFVFRSRDGGVHGAVSVHIVSRLGQSSLIQISGNVNPTGSPALVEHEPATDELSTAGYNLREE